MSGMKPPELTQFYAKLHARGLDTSKLAELAGRSRPIVTKVLNGSKRRGPAWVRIRPYLTSEEVALLDVAHRSAWNTRRVEKRPRWTAEKAAVLQAGSDPANT